jgi:hypothetical protein
MNLTVGFRAVIDAPADKMQKVVLRVAAATIYRAWLNGEFLGCGPARGPHGYFRVDEWNLSGKLAPGKNLVAIEVAGYNCNSYCLLDQPSFCQAEVIAGDRVLASTAGDGVPFSAHALDYRVQKVQRYSFQRPFIEVYRLTPSFDQWLRGATVIRERIRTTEEFENLKKELKRVREELQKEHERLQEERKDLKKKLETIRPQDEQTFRKAEALRAQVEDLFRTQSQRVDMAVQQPRYLLARHVPYPEFAVRRPVCLVAAGRVERREKVDRPWKDR